jgi:superfamily II DNA or RNA helicase
VDRTAWAPDRGLVEYLHDQMQDTLRSYHAKPDLITEHANHEESIRVGGYANRTLLELVQNAADAIAGSVDGGQYAGRVEIVLDPDREVLYCANAGRPVSKDGLRSITMAHISGKRGDEIGRFGLGFKSVLAVSDRPQVFSRSVSFEFNSPSAQAELAHAAPGARRYPLLRTAVAIDADREFSEDAILAELGEWAATVVRLPEAKKLERLRDEIENFATEFLLFVSAVREVRLRILGPDGLTITHLSRDLGNGLLRIERPDGDGDEWIVQDRMHAPSAHARKEVGEAVSRSEVKVTVALPRRQSRLRIGQFWSYFPLQDRTSASGLFNAPWSVNDDRTTLLRNDYNREILQTIADTFVDLLPRVITSDDPAAHLDYMPARGRETLGFGDETMIAHVRAAVSRRPLIPDATGSLCFGLDLRPLDFAVKFAPEVHEGWSLSPNTGADVPHWRCYSTDTRATRLRDLFIAGMEDDFAVESSRDQLRALERLPKRGLLAWLREWAEGEDPVSAANALKTVMGHRSLASIEQAKVILTTDGPRAIMDKDLVFLHQQGDVHLEGAVFVDPEFLSQPGVEALLKQAGFRDMDPETVLNARVAALPDGPSPADLEALWDAVLDVPVHTAAKILDRHRSKVMVPTQDGAWARPVGVFDIPETLGAEVASRLLDRERCLPEVAHRIGVIQEPVANFLEEEEPLRDDYRGWARTHLNSKLGPGDRPIERIDLEPGEGPGPFSVLLLLHKAGASPALRERWTVGLMELGDRPWTCEDLDSGRTYEVQSPARWAVEQAGIVRTTRGFAAPGHAAHPSLLRFEALLPLFRGSGRVADALGLPSELEQVAPEVLRASLEAPVFADTIADDTLVEFILTAVRVAFPDGGRPASMPARVGRVIEPRSPDTVYVASSEDERKYLATRGRPYLFADGAEAEALVATVGCRRFEDSFAFSMVVDGLQSSQPIRDVFTGLRSGHVAASVAHASIARAVQIAKRVQTIGGGVEDQPLEWALDGNDLVVRDDLSEARALAIVNDAFGLGLDHAELARVQMVGLGHRLEGLRAEAKAATTDAERLEVYFGPDTLREALPKGLWGALESQGLVDDETSLGELVLTVYGTDAIRMLAEAFREEGFSDVPSQWAGGQATISWLRKMGFGTTYAGRRTQRQDDEFVVPGAVKMNELHDFQEKISGELREVLTELDSDGHARKAMVELPTGAGKTRVASETALRLFIEGALRGPILWIAQSQELCEQAVQTWSTIWRWLGDERPLTVGRLWESNVVHEPETDFSVIVATDAKLETLLRNPDYDWLANAAAVFVDEAHRAGSSERYTRILSWLGVAGREWTRPLIGLSATPFKGGSDGTDALAGRFGRRKLTAFDEDPYRQLAERKVLARVEREVLRGVDVSLSDAEINDARTLHKVSDTVMTRIGRDQARMAALVEHICGLDEEWPILVFTPTVLSAQVLAATLRYRGRASAAVSGETGRQRRREIITEFKGGGIQVLTNCDLLTQGFDAPGVRALYIARPTFSPGAYIQMVGRGLRGPANGGKEECLIVDLVDNFGEVNDLLGYREYEDLWQEQRS